MNTKKCYTCIARILTEIVPHIAKPRLFAICRLYEGISDIGVGHMCLQTNKGFISAQSM